MPTDSPLNLAGENNLYIKAISIVYQYPTLASTLTISTTQPTTSKDGQESTSKSNEARSWSRLHKLSFQLQNRQVHMA